MNKVIWYLKQLLPLRYESNFKGQMQDFVDDEWKDNESLSEINCTWNMWFGRCFNEVYTEGWK